MLMLPEPAVVSSKCKVASTYTHDYHSTMWGNLALFHIRAGWEDGNSVQAQPPNGSAHHHLKRKPGELATTSPSLFILQSYQHSQKKRVVSQLPQYQMGSFPANYWLSVYKCRPFCPWKCSVQLGRQTGPSEVTYIESSQINVAGMC